MIFVNGYWQILFKEALPRDFSGKNFVTLGFQSEIHVQRVGNNCTNDPMTYVTFL